MLTLRCLHRCLGSRETFDNIVAYDFEWAVISQGGDHGPIRYDTMINSVMTNSGEKLSISSVANGMAPAGTHLLLRAPRGGITTTAIGSESSIQLTSSSRYLRLWTVRIDCVEEGDSGSWIVDQATGELLGMLVATCKTVCEAYILPIKDIFTEIEICSGHLARLPALDVITDKEETKIASMEESKVTPASMSVTAKDLNLLYRPLQAADDIRVLKLLPDVWGAVVHCELSVDNLGDPAAYEGLCYVLGTSESTSEIFVNGQSISVNSNLALALDDLRYIDRPRCLWVDALCINPENVEERDSQVPLLAPILLQARGVCIWLGLGNHETRRAFSYWYSTFKISDYDDVERADMIKLLVDTLYELFVRAWFPRGAVQAICLARHTTIHCGRDSIPWKAFLDTVSVLVADPFVMAHQSEKRCFNVIMLSEFVSNIENSIRWLDDGQIERKSSLESLLMSFSWLETTCAHDSIYSILSLASDVYPLPKTSVTSSAKDFLHEPPPPESTR